VATTKDKMTWLITGGSGQLAQSLASHLKNRGISNLTFSREELDISEDESIEAISRQKPSVIVNCAAYTAVDRAESEQGQAIRVNVVGAGNVAVAARELSVPMVHISTDYVFSGPHNTPWLVSDEPNPESEYGRTKLAGEQRVQKIYPAGVRILRTAWLYSSHGGNFAKTILKKLLTTQDQIRVVGDQVGQPTTTNHLANQIFIALERQVPAGVYHATNAGQASWFEFAAELANLLGEPNSRISEIRTTEYPTVAPRPSYSVLDNSIWGKLGIEPMPDWRDALQEVFPEIVKEVEREIEIG